MLVDLRDGSAIVACGDVRIGLIDDDDVTGRAEVREAVDTAAVGGSARQQLAGVGLAIAVEIDIQADADVRMPGSPASKVPLPLVSMKTWSPIGPAPAEVAKVGRGDRVALRREHGRRDRIRVGRP